MAKRAQGLPLHFIVIAAIAALVLVLVIAFTIGGFGAFGKKIFGAGKVAAGEPLDVVRATCAGLCDDAKSADTKLAWQLSGYCKKTFNIDLDGDGIINATKGEVGLHCWNESIGVDCSTYIGGTEITHANCQ